MKSSPGALAACLLAWFPPPEGEEIDARAGALRLAEFVNVMIGAHTKKG